MFLRFYSKKKNFALSFVLFVLVLVLLILFFFCFAIFLVLCLSSFAYQKKNKEEEESSIPLSSVYYWVCVLACAFCHHLRVIIIAWILFFFSGLLLACFLSLFDSILKKKERGKKNENKDKEEANYTYSIF